ncbi:uncharacterized protein [Leptinotarsa decemlineata]|uniref:uncharacterized protein n=1 Tax=Leptinotarsa decemlineata TaxID=7539 RepID=UPI000C253A0D|nr:uncharacterized protein LOC111501831 [Leptinotarsa decemlineata]
MQKKCERKVANSKYEHNAPEIRNWWLHLFEILETDAAIKPEWRLSVLKEILPARILNRILLVLSVQEEKFKFTPPHETKRVSIVSNKSFATDKSINSSCQIRSSSNSSFMRHLGLAPVACLDPYLNFFKRRPDRAAIWRELPPLSFEEMNLNQIADAITEAIAKDFVEWVAAVGGDQETSVNVKSIIEMFEIGSKMNCATTLCVNLEEVASVTEKVAEALKAPQKSKRNTLHREIRKDQKASNETPKIVAFGRRLPTESQVVPPQKNIYKKWLKCEKVPQKLETMAAVWQGITHLRSTKSFCEYLFKEHPEIKPPKYLVECGMMDPKKILGSRGSVEKEDSFGNVSNSIF